tara:strand:- start:34 stop:429 length:396 start_codon:yes stop_codon:yes gene_type:complete
MAKVKIDFSEKTVAEKIATATNIIIKMSANDLFHAYQNEMDQAANSVDLLSEAYLINISNGNQNTNLIVKRERELTEQMSLLAFYVQIMSKGQENIIRMAGFEAITEDAISDSERPNLQKQLAEIGIMRVQ